MGYDHDWHETDNTKDACYAYLHEKFPLTSNISFLNNDFKELPNDIIVVGCTLFTDFQAFDNREVAMLASEKYLNDYRYVHTYDNFGTSRLVNVLDYEKWFKESLQFIEGMCEANPTCKIIVLTHHAPSLKSLSPEYVNDILSASYVSNLEDFIKKHRNIKMWCHGHVHRPFNYKIGECDVICNPFGYYNENEMRLSRYIGEVYEL